MAKLQEERANLKVVIHHVDAMENGGPIKTTLFKMTGQRLYPNVFINGKQIGGNDSIQRLHSSGELSTLLSKTFPSKWAART
jgi:glutaredoxin